MLVVGCVGDDPLPNPCSAQRHGLLCEIEDDDDDKDEFCEPFFAHCKAHADKDLMKRKVRAPQRPVNV